MKIKKLSCEQFAGIRDRELSFEDGINLIYGKNESGKSTLVNLLSRILFQNARIDGRKDKDFKERYFPGIRKGTAVAGDFINGKLTFDAGNNTYTLTKEWGSDSRCTLSTPDGLIRDSEKIREILKEALLYGEGVYSEMLFSSQRNTDSALQTILDESQKTDSKKELTDVLSQAFSESDGISAETIEQAIQAKIDEIAGKHWDEDKEAPTRKNTGRWTTGLGEILKAYYDLDDARKDLDKLISLVDAVDKAATDYTVAENNAQEAEDAVNRFDSLVGPLTAKNECQKRIKYLEAEANKQRNILLEWPKLAHNLKIARALAEEKKHREILDQYTQARNLYARINNLQEELNSNPYPTAQEISDVKAAQKKVLNLENKLCGMNLTAAIEMLGGNTIRITSLRTGQALDVAHSPVSITEAVKISIPDVIEMQLSPANVNVNEIEAAIAGQKKIISDIFTIYKVENIEQLEQLAAQVVRKKDQIQRDSDQLRMILGTTSYDELESKVKGITSDVRSREIIEEEVFSVCGKQEAGQYIAAKEAIVHGYEKEYGSIELMNSVLSKIEDELHEAQASTEAAQSIPAEYANISDPSNYLAILKKEHKTKQELRDKALTIKTDVTSKLESFQETLSDDPAEKAEEAKRIFDEKKALLSHWRHIYEVFVAQKKKVQNNPMQDLSDSFARYLGIISEGSISSEFPDLEKLNMSIYSDDRLMDYGKLSEGTKETVSLAFRLAVLDHLFPEGGGVIVFDDPFNDMDVDRTARSCELIKECAKRHQVIFLTCKKEYMTLLGGHQIQLEK